MHYHSDPFIGKPIHSNCSNYASIIELKSEWKLNDFKMCRNANRIQSFEFLNSPRKNPPSEKKRWRRRFFHLFYLLHEIVFVKHIVGLKVHCMSCFLKANRYKVCEKKLIRIERFHCAFVDGMTSLSISESRIPFQCNSIFSLLNLKLQHGWKACSKCNQFNQNLKVPPKCKWCYLGAGKSVKLG